MNYCVPMNGKLHAVTPAEAEVHRAILCTQLTHNPECDQPTILRQLAQIDEAMTTELHYGDLCTMPAAPSGWTPDP
jgi:hypothetical protein